LKNHYLAKLASLFAITGSIFLPARVISVSPEKPVLAQITGKNWHYDLTFRPEHPEIIQKLIQCESQGVNISRPDSDGIVSDGILQFHEDGTWQDMERLSGFKGSPLIPSDAIFMADWMIGHGFLRRWSCARILKLIS
jgi:hypothetical protein